MRTLKKVLALSMVFAMAFSMMAGAAFNDQDKIDASLFEDIQLLTALEVFQGDEKGDFNPTDNVTRAQAAKMIYVLKNNGQDDEAAAFKGNSVYSDVPSGHWAEGYINYATNLGIMSGWTEGSVRKFDPNGNVTGIELTKMLLCMIGYRADIQGYTGNGWQTNVLRDGATSAITTNYLPTIYNAAPRQWTARLMANAINAPYVSYSRGEVVQGSSTDATKSYGEQYLGLCTVEGYLRDAGKVAFDGTEITLDDDGNEIELAGETDKGKPDLTTADYVKSSLSRNNVNTKVNVPTSFKTTVDPSLLGQYVKVYYKNSTLTTMDAKVYSVLPTGKSKVYETTLGDVTTGQSGASVAVDNQGETLKIAGYNGGSAKTYVGANPTTKSDGQWGVDAAVAHPITMVENLKTVYKVNALKRNTKGDDEASVKNFGVLSGNSNEAIRFVDMDGDGWIDLAFTDKVDYAIVTAHNAERNTIRFEKDGGGVLRLIDNGTVTSESAYKKINFVNDVAVDDVVSVKLNRTNGTDVWDVAKIEPTTGSVTGYSSNDAGTEYTNITLNGEGTKFAKKMVEGYTKKTDDDSHILNDTTFYTDGKFVIYSKGGESVASVGNLAYVIGKANTDWFGTTDYAKVLLSDGTQGQYEVKATYHLDGNNKLVKDTNNVIDEHKVMSYTISDNKITLSELKSDTNETGIRFVDGSTGVIYKRDSKTYADKRVSDDAYFFVVSKVDADGGDNKYKDAKYNVVKASELGNKDLETVTAQKYATKKSSGDGITYVVFGTMELESSAVSTAAEYAYVKSAPTYTTIDGDPAAQMTVVLPNGEESVIRKTFTSVSGANEQITAWKNLRGTLIAYDLDSEGNVSEVRHVDSIMAVPSGNNWDSKWVKAEIIGWNGSIANLNVVTAESEVDGKTVYTYEEGVLANVASDAKIHVVNTTDESYTTLVDGSVEKTARVMDIDSSKPEDTSLVGPSAYVYMVKDGSQWKITDIFSADEGRILAKLWKADSDSDASLNK